MPRVTSRASVPPRLGSATSHVAVCSHSLCVMVTQPQPFPLTSGVEPYFWGFKESDFEGKPELIKRAFHVQNGSNQDVQKYLMRRAVALFGLGPNDTGSAPVQGNLQPALHHRARLRRPHSRPRAQLLS